MLDVQKCFTLLRRRFRFSIDLIFVRELTLYTLSRSTPYIVILIFGLTRKKGRSRISTIWVPRLGFDTYWEGDTYCILWYILLPLKDKFTPSINSRKFFFQQFWTVWTNFEKSKNQIFSKTAQLILKAKIYVIEGTKKVLKKIREPTPLIRRGWTKLLKFLNNFLNMNYFLNTHHFSHSIYILLWLNWKVNFIITFKILTYFSNFYLHPLYPLDSRIVRVKQTQTSNKPKLRTNPNFEQTETSNKPKLRTNPNSEQT